PTVLRANSPSDAEKFANRAEIYPKEIYLGDTIFFLAYKRNITEDVIENLTRLAYGDYRECEQSVFPHTTAEAFYNEHSCSFPTETSFYALRGMLGMAPRVEFTAQPNEEFIVVRSFFEFPSLREQNEEFWQEVSKDLEKQDSVTVTLKVKYRDLLKNSPYGLSLEASFEVIVKARPKAEQELLEQWRLATPWDQLLSNRGNPPRTRNTGSANITIGSKEYNPWLFIRVGNRKPSDPNNPTSVEGWRELESKFQPSVLLDDIVFTRMQLEYYSAQNDNDADAKRKVFIDWINAKPLPQRAVYLGTLLMNNHVNYSQIEERHKELYKAVYATYAQLEKEVSGL
ncbi:MAG: hypothetical protein Q4G03_04825, partial [Planctomycetia bacterium]|nr:hypothetical protein [Planctomycetia bacterium]